MSYFQTKFSGAPIPQTDHRQTRSMLAQFKEQTAAKREKAKGLSEDQKRLEMVAMGLDPNLDKGLVQSMSRGELKGHIEKMLTEAGRKKDLQTQANKDREFQAAGNAQKSLEKSRGDALTHSENVHAYTKKQDRRKHQETKRPSPFHKNLNAAFGPDGKKGFDGPYNTAMAEMGESTDPNMPIADRKKTSADALVRLGQARNWSKERPKGTLEQFQEHEVGERLRTKQTRELDRPTEEAGTSEEVTTPKGKVIGHLVHTGDGFPKFVGPGTASAKPAELQVADALIQAAKDGEKAKFMALAHKHRIESKFHGVFYPPWIVEVAKVQGWTLRENPKK